MYQMFRPNLGPSSVLDQLHGMVSCVSMYVQAPGGGGGAVGNAWTGNVWTGMLYIIVVELRRLIGCNTYVRTCDVLCRCVRMSVLKLLL